MSRVEVLTPVRIETLFRPADDGTGDWTMHLRLWPEDVALTRRPEPATTDELAVLSAALGAPDEDAAFRAAADALGPRRAWWLWRTATEVDEGAGTGVGRSVRATGGVDEEVPVIGAPSGLPAELAVWLVLTDGTRELVETLTPDEAAIAADLAPESVNAVHGSLNGEGDPVWWQDYGRAQQVGLGAAIRLTDAVATSIAALVVVGTGQTPAADLLGAHLDAARLTLLGPGVPTNSTGGETAHRRDPAHVWRHLLDQDVSSPQQQGLRRLLIAFGAAEDELGDYQPAPAWSLPPDGLDRLVVETLWPVLWGRTLHDLVGAPLMEPVLADWAVEHLRLHGPLPTLQIDDQPYGVLPTSVFSHWVTDPDGDPAAQDRETRTVRWADGWRTAAAAGARAACPVPGQPPVVGAGRLDLLRLYGRHAPSRYWRVRPVLDLPDLQAARLAAGERAPTLSPYDRLTSAAWRDTAYPQAPVAAAGTRRHLPTPDQDEEPDPALLHELIDIPPESLYYGEWVLGLLGHLLRESLVIWRARVGRAWLDLQAGRPTDVLSRFPLDGDFVDEHLMQGSVEAAHDLLGAPDREGQLVGERFLRFLETAHELVRVYEEEDPEAVLTSVRAALDTAALRVDPWLTAVAGERVAGMVRRGAGCHGGVYGWVDAPRPWTPDRPAALRPGPTAAGLLHAPSYAQAQVAAVLRDAAVAHPGDDRWRLRLTSATVRRAVDLGERVRLGVHPFEALGLEVEAVAGDPDVVRLLRRHYPTVPEEQDEGGTTTENDPLRRVCDGLGVLAAAREGTLPAGVPDTFADQVLPLDEVVDTFADLLTVDGVHALMTRSPEAGGAAMEAAAGLATPPELWGIRTPREATSVSVSCWVALPAGEPQPGQPDDGLEPAAVADPAFTALLPAGALDHVGDPEVTRTALLLGGGEVAVGVPSSTHHDLAEAMLADLTERWRLVWESARSALVQVEGIDPTDPAVPAVLTALDRRWRLGLAAALADVLEDGGGTDPADTGTERQRWTPEDLHRAAVQELQERVAPGSRTLDAGPEGEPAEVASPPAPTSLDGLRDAIRTLVGRHELPVLPVVDPALLPTWSPAPAGQVEQEWLEIVAAVRPRLQPLEAHQLTTAQPWPVTVHAPGGDPWASTGPVQLVFGTGLADPAADRVAVTMLDGWADSIPSSRHVTQAAFGFNAPRSRAAQALLLAVPPDLSRPLAGEELLEVVLEVRELAVARAARPTDRGGLPVATPSAVVQLETPLNLLEGWS